MDRKDSSPRCLSQRSLRTLLWVIRLWWISLLFQMTNQRSNHIGVSLKWLRHTAVMIAHTTRLRSRGAVLQKCPLCLHSLALLRWLRLQPWRMCTGEWSDVSGGSCIETNQTFQKWLVFYTQCSDFRTEYKGTVIYVNCCKVYMWINSMVNMRVNGSQVFCLEYCTILNFISLKFLWVEKQYFLSILESDLEAEVWGKNSCSILSIITQSHSQHLFYISWEWLYLLMFWCYDKIPWPKQLLEVGL